jgi:hypothetical protein
MSKYNSLSFVPSAKPPQSVSVGESEYGINDSLRNGLVNVKRQVQGQHPLQARLEQASV